jgi:hypothetical protein
VIASQSLTACTVPPGCPQVLDALALGPVPRLAALQGFTAMDQYSRDVAYSLLASMCDIGCVQGVQEVVGEMGAGKLAAVHGTYQQCHQRLLATCAGAQPLVAAAEEPASTPASTPASRPPPPPPCDNNPSQAQSESDPSGPLDAEVVSALQHRLPRLVPFHKATLLHMGYGLLLLLHFFEALAVLQPPQGLRMQLLAHMRGMAADVAIRAAPGGRDAGAHAAAAATAAEAAAAAGGGGGVQQRASAAACQPAAASGGTQRFALLYMCLVDACQRRSLLEVAVLLHSLVAWLLGQAQPARGRRDVSRQGARQGSGAGAAAGSAGEVQDADVAGSDAGGAVLWPELVSPCLASGKELAAGLLKVLAAASPSGHQQALAARSVMRLSGSDRLGLALLYVFAHDCCQRRCVQDTQGIAGLLLAA